MSMNRRDVIKGALISAGAISAGSAVAQQVNSHAADRPGREGQHQSYPSSPIKTNHERMPNILWVCTDQQRFDTLAGLSNSIVKTPNLQKFMSESATFTNAFCQTPICSPSRASFLTGRYPHITGLRANGQRIRPTERLITRMLADYQYTCGLV